MATADEHCEHLVRRAQEAGIQFADAELGEFGQVRVSYRRNFRWRWVATTLHVFTFMAALPAATAEDLDAYTAACAQYAKTHKPGLFRGLQTGSAAIAVAVVDSASGGVRKFAAGRPKKRFAMLALPAVVDAGTGETITAAEHLVWGAVYDAHLRSVLRDHVGSSGIDPEPGSVRRMKLIFGVILSVAFGIPLLMLLLGWLL